MRALATLGLASCIAAVPLVALLGPGCAGAQRTAGEGRPGESAMFPNRLVGVVTDPGGRPVEGVRLRLLRAEQLLPLVQTRDVQPPAAIRHDTSRSDGSYVFRGLEPGLDYVLFADHDAFARLRVHGIEVRGDGECVQDLRLWEGAVCEGRVTDGDGDPVAGATLTLATPFVTGLGGVGLLASEKVARSDRAGRFRFERVSEGVRSLSVVAEGYGSLTRYNLYFDQDRESVTADFRLGPGFRIAGRVHDLDRAGVEAARVEVIRYAEGGSARGSAISREDGEFSIRDLPSGDYALVARADGFSDSRVPRVRLRGSDAEVDVELARKGGVRGRVIDAVTGKPVPSFDLTLYAAGPDTPRVGRALSSRAFEGSASGELELSDLDAGRYFLGGRARGYAPSFSEAFAVTPGRVTRDAIVRMTEGGRIEGRVVDALTLACVAGARVSVLRHNRIETPFSSSVLRSELPGRPAERSPTSGAEGELEVSHLEPGVYQVRIEAAGYARRILSDVRVTDGVSSDLGWIRMERGATVTGTVYGEGGRPMAGAQVSMSPMGGDPRSSFSYRIRADGEGRYEVSDVPGGTYRLAATRDDEDGETYTPFEKILDMKRSQVTVVLVAGEVRSQDLDLGEE